MTLDVYGDVKEASETGDGPVDAIFKCIKTLYPHDVNLQLYQVHAVTEGTDAQATVSVKIEEKGKTTVGQAADTDTLVASANAYINALNKMIIKRDKTAPMEQENQKMRGVPSILMALLVDGIARGLISKELHDEMAIYVLRLTLNVSMK